MKHDWEDTTPWPQMMTEPRRKCRNCDAEQQQHTEHLWMRVVGRRWLPLVGRCKGKVKPRRAR